MRAYLTLLAAIAISSVAVAQSTPEGALTFQRCAACHLPDGAGVPGAFPPLRQDIGEFAADPAGRRYLVLVVIKGLVGPIVAEGKSYSGVMPAQSGLSDAQVAAVLNHVLATSASHGPSSPPFSETEVTQLRTNGEALSAAEVARLNAGLARK